MEIEQQDSQRRACSLGAGLLPSVPVPCWGRRNRLKGFDSLPLGAPAHHTRTGVRAPLVAMVKARRRGQARERLGEERLGEEGWERRGGGGGGWCCC